MFNKTKISDVIPYIITILSAVLLIVGAVFYVMPTVKEIIAMRQKTSDGKIALETVLKPKLEVLLKQDVTILDDNFKLALNALPQESNSLGLMNSLERIGNAYGVNLQGIAYSGRLAAAPAAPSADADITSSTASPSQTFSISTNADYPTVMALIKGLENLLPINSISTVRFAKGAPGGGILALSFAMDFYYLPPVADYNNMVLSGLTDSEEQSLISIQKMKDYPLVPVYADPGKENPFQ